MSNKENDIWLSAARESFSEAIEDCEFEVAMNIIDDVKHISKDEATRMRVEYDLAVERELRDSHEEL